jgi:hypothetical protein
MPRRPVPSGAIEAGSGTACADENSICFTSLKPAFLISTDLMVSPLPGTATMPIRSKSWLALGIENTKLCAGSPWLSRTMTVMFPASRSWPRKEKSPN